MSVRLGHPEVWVVSGIELDVIITDATADQVKARMIQEAPSKKEDIEQYWFCSSMIDQEWGDIAFTGTLEEYVKYLKGFNIL